MDNNIIYPNLGKNIKSLRKAFGKSLKQMADDLEKAGFSDERFSNEDYRFIQAHTISQYENGKRNPEREKLSVIAKYFKVTEDELLYGDFSNFKINSKGLNDKTVQIDYFNCLWPLKCTQKALENENFKKAYAIQKKNYDNVVTQVSSIDLSETDKIIDLYEQSYKEDKIFDSIYNLLSWTMLEDCLYSICKPSVIERLELEINISPMELIEMLYLNKSELEIEDYEKEEIFKKELKEYIEKQEVTFYTYISVLKRNDKYTDFADYYIALRYFWGLLSENSYETNRLIGTSLLNTLDYIGNKYVKNLKSINIIDDNHTV